MAPNDEPLRFYHRTFAAEAILRDGFKDGTGTYLTTHEFTGVWLSDTPLDVNEGAHGDVVLAVDLPVEIDLAAFEWVEEDKPYREWLVPADLLSEHGRVSVVAHDAEEEARNERIARLVAEAPPLGPEALDRIAALLPPVDRGVARQPGTGDHGRLRSPLDWRSR